MPSDRPTLQTAIVFATDAQAERGFINPARLSDDERLGWIARVRAGEVLEIPFSAEVFWEKTNANFFRVRRETLPALVSRLNLDAGSATPPQVLYEHSRGVWSRVGHVTAARSIERDGVPGIAADMVLTDPVAQEAFVRRNLDRFSPGFSRTTSAECSVCGATARSWYETSCDHQRGVEYAGGVCEVIITVDAIEEVSFTGDPAVEGTAILAAGRRQEEAAMPTQDKPVALTAEQEELATLRAEKAARDAELADLKKKTEADAAALAAANDAAFASIFDAAVGSKVLPAELETQRILFDALGAAAYRETLAARASIAGHDQRMLGAHGGTPDESAGRVEPDNVERAVATLEFARRNGILKSSKTREQLVGGRFGSLRFDGANRKIH